MTVSQVGSILERIVLKDGQLFIVADRNGDITALNREGQGLYFQDARHLSLFEMHINGTRLTLLSSASQSNFSCNMQFTNDLLLNGDGNVIAEPRTIKVNRERFVSGSFFERIDFLNYNAHPVCLTVRFTCGSDFRDMFEVRGFEVENAGLPGEIAPIAVERDRIVFGYRGAEGMLRRTYLMFDPAPEHTEIVNARLKHLKPETTNLDHRDEGVVVPPMLAAAFLIEVPAMGERSITVRITPEMSQGDTAPVNGKYTPVNALGLALDDRIRSIRDKHDAWRSACTRIESDHEVFNQVIDRAVLDLGLLVEDFDGDLVTTAGIPWFAVPFGRDSLTTATQALVLRPTIARGTLRFLARHQGTSVNTARGEEPGKILHEIRPGELGHVKESIYYGSVDSTPLFLVALGEYVNWSGDLDLARELLPNAEAALAWLEDYGDIDGDGFLEAIRNPATGLGSQGWKDSPDAINHGDGRRAEAPIALAEVQAYAYGAHAQMAKLYGRLGDTQKQRAQVAAAETLRNAFLQRLAIEDDDGPFWAMGLDAAKQPIAAITTNPGHALWTGLLRGQLAQHTAQRLMVDDLLCGWGLRTLSSKACTFNPMSYHNGSVWPHENALIALGMKRAGADAAACEVASQVFEAALAFPGARLPELWCGFTRDPARHMSPGQYPVGCSPQAWAAGSAFMLLQALLGLEVDAFERTVRLRPVLPTWLSQLSFRKLQVGDTRIDLDVVRDGHRVIVDVLEDGGLRIEARQTEVVG